MAELCEKRGVFLISDEAYSDIVYDKEHFSLSSLKSDSIYSIITFSKTFSMTGWRLGAGISRNEEFIEYLKKANYTQTAGVPPFIQYAGKEALENMVMKEQVNKNVNEFRKRRDLLYDGLSGIKGIEVIKPEGAFYMFPKLKGLEQNLRGHEKEEAIHNLLMENGIATVPGSCFGAYPGSYVRISFSATPIKMIKVGINRLNNLF